MKRLRWFGALVATLLPLGHSSAVAQLSTSIEAGASFYEHREIRGTSRPEFCLRWASLAPRAVKPEFALHVGGVATSGFDLDVAWTAPVGRNLLVVLRTGPSVIGPLAPFVGWNVGVAGIRRVTPDWGARFDATVRRASYLHAGDAMADDVLVHGTVSLGLAWMGSRAPTP